MFEQPYIPNPRNTYIDVDNSIVGFLHERYKGQMIPSGYDRPDLFMLAPDGATGVEVINSTPLLQFMKDDRLLAFANRSFEAAKQLGYMRVLLILRIGPKEFVDVSNDWQATVLWTSRVKKAVTVFPNLEIIVGATIDGRFQSLSD